MKIMKLCALATAFAGLALTSGCVCYTEGNNPPFYRPFFAPVYVEPVAPPPPVVVYNVPEYYVWDGFEYVGVCGGSYVYWQVNTWVICDSVRVERFHRWEFDGHRDWREHAFRPDRRDPRPGFGARAPQHPDQQRQAPQRSQQQRPAPSRDKDRPHVGW